MLSRHVQGLPAPLGSRRGLAQRVGLTFGDVWIISTAAVIVFLTQGRHKRAGAQRAGPEGPARGCVRFGGGGRI